MKLFLSKIHHQIQIYSKRSQHVLIWDQLYRFPSAWWRRLVPYTVHVRMSFSKAEYPTLLLNQNLMLPLYNLRISPVRKVQFAVHNFCKAFILELTLLYNVK